MTTTSLSQAGVFKKSEIFLLLFVLESLAFAILPLSARSEWMPALLVIHASITATFLVASLLLRSRDRGSGYWPVLYALFAGGTAILVSTLWHMNLARPFGFADKSPEGISIAIFFQSLLRVMVLLVLMAAAGAPLRSMYLQKGNLRIGLGVSLPAFFILAAIAFLPLISQEGMLNQLMKLLPWILLFVLSNGFSEELLFRGLLLKRYELFLGKGFSNLLAAIVFTLLHAPVTYVPNVLLFLLVTFLLALIWGTLMQKTGSVWGPALFHAGADCIIIFGIYAGL